MAPVVFSCGVFAGVADTGPVGPAALAGATPARSTRHSQPRQAVPPGLVDA